MNCSQFEEILHDLDRPGRDCLNVRGAAFVHAESCDRCAQLLIDSEALDFALRTLAQRNGHKQAPARIEELLLNEFRRRNVSRPRRMRTWQIAALATAASLLLAIGVAFQRRPAEKPEASPADVHRTEQTPHSRADVVQRSVPQAGNTERTGNVASSHAPAAHPQQVADNQAPESESATPFVALPYADDAMVGEGGTIVRVTLSGPALASLGLPVTDIGASGRIPADIVVSEDGTPQAIRLVSQSELQ
jgi:hypothetical protein